MIAATVEELTPIIGTRPACRALGASSASVYRRRRPPEPKTPAPRPTPERALSAPERQQVLECCTRERFVDVSPEEISATLLDEGPTCARPARCTGSSPPPRRGPGATQPAHPPAPTRSRSCSAERPNELWSWDVSKLKGPAKWTWFYLYVVLDVFSRYVVGWTVQYRETAQLAKALIEQATEQQQITPKILTLHADRGGPMRAKPLAFLLADLGVTKTHSRPYTSSDNPYSESNFKTLKYRPGFPARFDSIEHARPHCRAFFDWYNHAHRHSGIGLMTPAAVHHGQAPRAARRPRRTSSTPHTPARPSGSSASRPPRPSYQPPRGSTSRRRSPPLTKFEREASHRT